MIVRTVHGWGEAGRPDVPGDRSGPAAADGRADFDGERERLARAAARINGLETLIVGWRETPRSLDANAGLDSQASLMTTCVVILAWHDVGSMVTASPREPTFLRERLGLRIEIEHAESYEVMSRTFGSLPMPRAVLRILTIRARPSAEAALFERLRDIQSRLTMHGLIASHVARRVASGGVEALVVSVWNDEATVERATGGRTDRPAFGEELEPWLEAVTVDTYHAIEIAPRLPMASGPPILVLDRSRRVVDLTSAAAATLGRTQDETVGQSIEDLATPGGAAGSERWSHLLEGAVEVDHAGESAWPLDAGGDVMIRWRLRRDVPVPGRHTILVRRVHEPEPTQEALDEALAEAFPPESITTER
ncbi:MAG: hypothetical protein ABJC39_10490 [Chloroflexota bacterium]